MTTATMALPAAMVLSGLKESHFSDGLNDIFNHGALLLKSPSLSSMVSSSSDEACSQESGISSMSSEKSSLSKNLAPYFDMLLTSSIDIMQAPLSPNSESSTEPTPTKCDKVMFENRDILNLAANIKWNWNFQIAQLKSGAQQFFENRSQYSRVLGAHMPKHIMIPCSFEGCTFEDPYYE